MSITVRCPTCGERVQAEKEQVGKLVTCDNCGGPVRIQAQPRASSPEPPQSRPVSLDLPPTPLLAPGGQWYYRVLGQEFGPFSFADLQAHGLSPDNEVRLGPSGRWILAERIPHLFDGPGQESSQWFYTQGGRQFGPVDLDAVKRLVGSGVLPLDERVRERRWSAAVSVKRWVASGFSVQRPLTRRKTGAGPAPNVPPIPVPRADALATQTASTPPPAPKAEWFYLDNGQRIGPLPLQSLQGLVQTGRLLPHDLVWKEGMDDWQAIGSLPGLESGQVAAQQPAPALGTRR
jgi:DNA-directed RNA polymerase subunit RPC12/RpoP